MNLEAVTADLKKAAIACDDFLSIASHELKTPLTSLKLQIQMRKRALDKGERSLFTPEKLSRVVNDYERQVNRLNVLVDDMLDIARLHSGKSTTYLETGSRFPVSRPEDRNSCH